MNSKLPLPTLETVKKGIDELLLIDNWEQYKMKSSPRRFEKKLHQLFHKHLGTFPSVIQLGNSDSFPFKLYRVRKKTANMNQSLLSEYSHPPVSLCKSYQRANIPYHPVFYCSANPGSALSETRKDNFKEQTYFLSEWEFRPNEKINICPFVFDNFHVESHYYPLSEQYLQKARDVVKDYTQSEIDAFEEVLKFLSQLFMYENAYVVTSFIAHFNLYANHSNRSDVFMYPCLPSNRKSINFAIHPNAVTQKMVLNKVFQLRIKDLDLVEGNFTISFIDMAKNINGKLVWSPINDDNEEAVSEIARFFNKKA